jgi:RimJ/RimL family protein N-acetyltransferase
VRVRSTTAPEIGFRPLRRTDFERLHGWLLDAEVLRWYSPSRPTRRSIERKYGPRIDGWSPTRVFVVELDGAGAGLCQTYRLGEYPAYAAALGADRQWAGLDYFIGEPSFRGRGLAHRIIDRFVREIVFADDGTTACVSSTDPANARSIGALERAGFEFLRDVQTSELEHLMILHRHHAAADATPAP